MKRRDFVRRLLGTSLGVGGYCFNNPFYPRFQIARASTGKTLIVIFQRGGCDGLNTIVPYGEDDYYNYRPTIAVAAPNVNDPAAAIDLDGFFGLHPGLAAFEPIYQAGDMAILPSVHYPNANRSHFEGQALVESAAATPFPGPTGFLNRHLSSHSHGGQLRAAAFADLEDAGLPLSMRGPTIVSTFNDLTQFNLGLDSAEETALLPRLNQIYNQSPNPNKVYNQLIHDFGKVVLNDLSVVGDIDFSGYSPANGASYPATEFGLKMKQTAQLIKEGIGLEVAALGMHKWDHHSNQGGGGVNGVQHQMFLNFSGAIAALYQDLGTLMDDVAILTMTEFGRTARENGAFGTDHGNAAAWFVINPSVAGGIYLGSGWPGLASAQLNGDRDLVHTIDYRDVVGEVISQHLGNNDLATVLPDHSYNPVGFLPGSV